MEGCVALRGPSMFNRWLKRAPHHGHSASSRLLACSASKSRSIPWGQSPDGYRHAPSYSNGRNRGARRCRAPEIWLGTSTIRDVIPYEFGGVVDLTFAVSGVECRIELPSDWLSNDGEPTWAASEKQQVGTEFSYVASGYQVRARDAGARKPFNAIQRLQLPFGKGEVSRPEASLAGGVASI